MDRPTLARKLASGLAGWLQLQASQGLEALSGEDSARFVVAQIMHASRKCLPVVGMKPKNWNVTKKRIDVALTAPNAPEGDWIGVIEVKWPGDSIDVNQVREDIIQDAMRLTFVDTNQLNAHFLVLGGSSGSLTALFDKKHKKSKSSEARRRVFADLLPRTVEKIGSVAHSEWSAHFPKAGERVPQDVFDDFDGKLKAQLLATSTAAVGADPVGSTFVWQCSRTRGTSGP
jgi:hypothetical protein